MGHYVVQSLPKLQDLDDSKRRRSDWRVGWHTAHWAEPYVSTTP